MKKKNFIFMVYLLAMSMFYLSCGDGGGGGTTTEQPDPNLLTISYKTSDVSGYFDRNEAYIGIFPAGNNSGSARNALLWGINHGSFNVHLEAASSFDYINQPSPAWFDGVDYYGAATFPLYTNLQGSPWTGNGLFHVGIIVDPGVDGSEDWFYSPETFLFITGTTIVNFDPDWMD